jgi:glycine/D-amino acid oxidase-like deaminating enzyme
MSKEICPDITILGAGAAGLMTAVRLSEHGYKVALVEKSSKVCAGPSVRNEGWLHAGTYHATSVKDQTKAVEVAGRCQYGYSVIKQLAPESITEPDMHSYAVFKKNEYVEYAQERWTAAKVFADSVLLRELATNCPEIDISSIVKAFRVADVSINTPSLYANLIKRIQEAGGEFYLDSTIVVDQNQQAWLRSAVSSQDQPLNTQLVINTTGYGMANFLSQYFGEEYSMRFWKSHLIVYPRLGKHNVFYIEPGEAAAIQHGRVTMIGQHEDAVVIDEPDFSPISDRVASVQAAAQRLYYQAYQQPTLATACLKPDLSSTSNKARSVGIDIHEPKPGYIFALPGKMTESPCLADMLVTMAEERNLRKNSFIGNTRTTITITPRPCDEWRWND